MKDMKKRRHKGNRWKDMLFCFALFLLEGYVFNRKKLAGEMMF